MNFSEHLNDLKTAIEATALPPKVDYFSGEMKEEDLKQMKFDGKSTYIFLGCRGGLFVPDSHRLEVDTVFGAYIITKETGNHNFSAMNEATNLAKLISKFRGNVKINTKLPVVQYIEELSYGGRNGSNYSVWAIVWEQRMALV